jgi:hypothetical protein
METANIVSKAAIGLSGYHISSLFSIFSYRLLKISRHAHRQLALLFGYAKLLANLFPAISQCL